MGDTSNNGNGRADELTAAGASGPENSTPNASAGDPVSTPAHAALLQNLASDPETKVTVSSDGHLTLVSKDGQEFPLPGADPLMATFRANPWPLINLLSDDRNALADIVKAATQNDGTKNATFVKLTEILQGAIPPPQQDPDETNSSSHDARSVTFQQLGALNGTNSPLSGNPLSPFAPTNDETPQLGGDDLKRGEFGAKGQNTGAGVGSGVGHLTGLGDEEPGLRNGEKITTSDNTSFPGLQTGVGTGIDHLWLLGDFEYYRASTDHLSVDGILPDHGRAPVYGPLITDDNPAFRLVEDHNFQGRIFDAIGVRVLNIKTSIDPKSGTVKLNPDGTFEFTPKYGYSGETSFDYSFTDPRTGEKITGTVDLTVEAVADPASISGAAITPEDTIVPTPVDVSLNDPDGSETIREVVISGIPPGATLGWDLGNPAIFTLQLDGSYIVTGDTDDIIAVLKTLTYDPTHDFSGQVVLGIDVTTIESNSDPKVKGYLDTETVHHDYVIDVIPVADLPPVTGDVETTDEDTRVHLDDLAGNLTDIDGSEVLSFEISNVDPNAKLEDTAGTEYPFTVELDGTKTYTLTPAQIGDVFFDPPPNDSGVFNMTIHATATEQANNDQATNTAPITVTVTPVEDLPTISGSSIVDEDTAVNFGGDIGIGPVIDADGSETITNVTITGIPAGVVPTGTNVGGATFVFTPGTGTITVTGGTEQDIRDTVASLGLTPPNDSDVNIDLQVTVTTTDGPIIATTPPYTHTIAVAAIADGSNIAGAASGNEDSPINLPITATLKDTDGSETYDYAEVTVPAGHTLTETSLPNGITKTAIPGGFRYEPGAATTTAQFQDFLANNLQVQAPLDSDVDFSVDVAIGTIESTLSGGEVTLLRKEDTATIAVTVLPVVDTPTIDSTSAMNEDAINDVNAPPVGANIVPHPVGVSIEAGISLGETAVGDTSEEITTIVLTGIPAGSTIGTTPVAGAIYDTSVAGQVTITGTDETVIRDALKTVTIVTPLHSDANIPLGVAVTIRDNDPDNAGDTTSATFNGTHTIAVAAVADGSNIAGVASGNEDSPIDLPITATLKDADGSETYDYADVTVPVGHTLTETSLPNGITKTAIAGGFRYEPGAATTTAQFQDFLANNLQVQAPLDSDVDFSVDVAIGTIESTLSGGEVTLLRKEDTATIAVTVLPVVDTPTIDSTSAMNEDAIVNPNNPPVGANIDAHTFGASIQAGIGLGETAVGDTSEEITQIVITGIPATATIGVGAVAGVTIDQSVAGQITITGPNEADIRAALDTLTIISGPHDDANIPLGVAVTIRDNDPDNAGDTTSATFNGTHTIAVAAVADGSNIAGVASGNEDSPIDLPITATLIDADGSETYDYADVTVPVGHTLTETSLPNGITKTAIPGGFRYEPGAATTTAQFQDFLANNLQVQAPLDSDVDFSVDVAIGTIESTLSGGEVTLLRKEDTATVAVTVLPVVDTPTIDSTSSMNEDAIVDPSLPPSGANIDAHTVGVSIEAGISLGETAVGDTSEDITQIVLTGIPVGSTIGSGVVAGAVIDTSVAGQITITGTDETAIRDALKTVTIITPTHDDANVPLGVAVTVRDTDPDNAGDTTSQVFNGTHTITVAAVADAPTGNGSGAGNEDETIPVSISIAHPDNADGSETIKDVVINNVPAGFLLTESSALGATLTDNGGGSYTVTGPSDAAINDLLANLALQIDPGDNSREHLDTEFNLSVTATTIESNPSEVGVGEIARLENNVTFNVPITVTAVADPVTHSGSSTIVEDISGTVGSDISYTKIDLDGTESVTQVTLTGFQVGSVITFDDVNGNPQTLNIVTGAEVVTLSGPHSAAGEAAIRTALDTLDVQAPPQSDVNFDLTVTATTTDNDASTNTTNWTHTVVVQAVADAPTVTSNNISGNEDTPIVLPINADRSIDGQTDGSETLSVRITLPTDGTGPVGTIFDNGNVGNGVTITDEGGGVYLVEGPGTGTPAAEEALIDTFLATGLSFQPRPQWSGSFTGANGILIEAISTEAATGGELADGPTFGGADNTSKTETVATRVDLTVNPVLDGVTFTNASTIVEENNGDSNPSDPDLIVPLGTRMGFTLADLDGSQDLDVTFSNIPTTAVVMFGATTIPNDGTPITITVGGVDTIVTLDNAGNLNVDGPDAAKAITIINTLTLTLLDDDDSNFTVGINGTTTEVISGASVPIVGTHDVIVQAVADTPDTDTGTATKTTIQEDSGFVGYPATVALNDTDGSESFQSVVVEFSTVGAGEIPQVQFTTTTGVTIDTTVPGQVTLTGGTPAQMVAALASLQIRPGANNGEDITITVTTTAVESNPSEGVGGVVGPEVTVPTATSSDSFVIPVDPVPEVPSITVPANLPGTEDTLFNLGGISVSNATNDPDGSESNFIEIDTSSFPTGTVFSTGGTTHSTVIGGFLRIPISDVAGLQMQTPLNYSGTVTLDVRAVTVDTSATNTVTSVSPTSSIDVAVVPVADAITPPSRSTGIEDNGPVAFGTTLAAGLAVTDNVVGGPGPGGDEWLSQVVFDLPADTATRTYTISGAFAPGGTGTFPGSGTAEVTFDAATRTYTITSTLITGVADPATLTDAQRDTAEADIRATLATFSVEMGPTHSDLDGTIAVTATALDVKDGVSSTLDSSFNHTVRIQAVADTPTIAATAGPNVTEDTGNIALNINPGRSPDEDNSETLSVRVIVPTEGGSPVGAISNGALPPGISVTDQGGGVYLVEATGADVATREATLDGFLNAGGLSFDPRANWSGQVDITIEAISTEAANGGQLAPGAFGGPDGTSKTETVATTVTVTVNPIVDTPTVKGNGVGLEDTNIPIPMSVTLGDKDGSETYTMKITGGVPAGAKIFGAGGAEIIVDGSGDYNLTPADVAALQILPPLHYSSAHDGDITLVTETTVTDDNGVTSAQQTFTNNIVVEVQGVADAPAPNPVNITINEDNDVPLGAEIIASLGGDVNNALVDNDGSESLTIIISGLPAGVIPSVGTFIGSGTFQIDIADLAALTLPVPEHFSGDYVAINGLTVTMVSQEVDGDQAESTIPIAVTVNPVINGATIDGFASWTPNATVTEDNDIPLADIVDHSFVDTDGSETVISYTFDFNTLVADAQIGATVTDAADLIANFINGTFVDNGNGTITVDPADVAALSLDATAFPDSNIDFTIPVSAIVRDTAGAVFVDKTETTNFSIDLIGDADIPTVFVNNATGLAANLIPLVLGGENTDQDSETLGRAESEDTLYYILTHTNAGASPLFNLVNSGGNQVGTPAGSGTFFLTPADLADLNVITRPGPGGDIELKLTTVTIENDGDLAQSTAAGTFTVEVTPNGGTVPPIAPLPPILNITPTGDDEDTGFTLIGTVNADPADPTNPSVTLLISNLPAGTTIDGAFLNVETGKWIALQADVNAGNVTINPPADFSGDLDLTFEAVAINLDLLSATTGDQVVSFPIDPVADGVAISAAPGVSDEDVPIDLNITLTARDGTPGNTPEDIDNTVFVRADSGTFSAGMLVVGGPFDGYTQLTLAELATLQITSDLHAHGPISIEVVASSTEPTDDADGDHTAQDTFTFTVDVAAVADAPTVTVPVAAVTGDEDTAISIVGLSAALVDADGSEVISAKISGVPDGTLFSAGSNNGDGSWTIPVADLAALTITPPLNFAGTMSLTLEAFALETSNGDTATTTQAFTVEVAPKADTVEILADNVTVDATGEAALDLNVRMADDRGVLPGEVTPETIAITFTGVPTGASLIAGSGGAIVDNGGGSWTFTGLEAQSNELAIKPSETSTPGNYTVNLSAVTIDGADTLATAVTDSFQVTVPAIVVGTAGVDVLTSGLTDALIYGLGDNDTLNGGAGSQFLDGGAGNDTMAGGTGNDTYAVDSAADIVTENAAEGTDTIQSSISIGALATNVENLTLTGGTDINGTGNGLDNVLTGNIGANTLNGGAGADTLVGGAGIDTLTGGTGADTFTWNAGETGTGLDTITDFSLIDGDILDLQDLLVGFGGASVLSAFLQTSESGGNTTISVDINGTAEGSNFVDLVVIESNVAMDLDDMKTNGNLIV